MIANSDDDESSQTSAIYVNKKGINELFEAMMTALMVHKPEDHLTFIRECLDKAEDNRNYIRWDFFLTKYSSSSVRQKQKRSLPPIVSSTPIIFILSSSGGITLCSRLLQRYHQINYLLINNIANIDDDEPIDLKQYEHRYQCICNAIEERRSQASGFLIAGELDEQNFLKQWKERLGRIDLIIIICSNLHEKIINQNFHILPIDLNNDFEDNLALAIHHFDQLFPQDAFVSQRSSMISMKTNYVKLPIIFCIDHRHLSIQNRDLLIDHEFEMANEEEKNNSFIYTLCQRLAEQLSFEHIHYGDLNGIFWTFAKLKSEISASMHTSSGYIIDHFPTSSHDLKRFQSEIGRCSILIYTGDHGTIAKSNEIIEKFQASERAIYVDCRMEVDEIYDDLKNEILKRL